MGKVALRRPFLVDKESWTALAHPTSRESKPNGERSIVARNGALDF